MTTNTRNGDCIRLRSMRSRVVSDLPGGELRDRASAGSKTEGIETRLRRRTRIAADGTGGRRCL